MNLAKALKTKNRLAGEVARLKAQINAFNVVRIKIVNYGASDEKRFSRARPIDVGKAMVDLEGKVRELINLKTAIAKANVGIYQKIEEMNEAKGMITFYEAMPEDRADDIDTEEDVVTATSWENIVTSSMKARIIETNRKLVEMLQDEIDEYNATTYIEI